MIHPCHILNTIMHFRNTHTMNVLPAGFTPPIGVRRTITDECFGMCASSSVYSMKKNIDTKHHLEYKTWFYSIQNI